MFPRMYSTNPHLLKLSFTETVSTTSNKRMISHIQAVLLAALPVFLIVLLGVFLRKWNIISKEIDSGITKLILHVLLPCLILHNLIGSKVASDLPQVITLAGLGAGIVIISLAITLTIAPYLGMERGDGRRSFAVATALQNYGFMALPLLMSLYPDPELLATLFLHNLGVEIAVFSIGVMVFTGKFSIHPKAFLKPPVIAVLIGILLNVTHLAGYIPSPISTSLDWLGRTAVPLSLLAIGMSIGELLPQTKYSIKVSLSAIIVRLLLLPTLIISIAYFLPLESSVKKILLIQAAMPAALFPIVLARHYGGKPTLVAEIAITTSIASFLTMPLIITIGGKILNLTT